MSDREIAFMGRITAGMTHEIRNVLAIIRESSGLMEDLLSLVPEGAFKYREKFLSVIGTIQEQVNRGVDLATQLNRFAHSMDEPIATADLNLLLTHIVGLMTRFARLKQVELRVSPPAGQLLCQTDPFRLQMVLAACIDACMEGLGKGDALFVRTLKGDHGVRVVVDSREATPEIPAASGPLPGLECLADLLQDLGIDLSTWRSDGRSGVCLTLRDRDSALA